MRGKKETKKGNGVQLLIRAVVRDPDGKLISDTGQKPSRSYVIQFLEFIYALGPGINRSATCTTGTEGSYYYGGATSMSHFYLNAPVYEATYGIVIGTDDTAVTNDNFKLAAQLTEGTGAGNITHNVMIVGAAAVVGANVDLVFKRAFTNSTGSTIIVKEAGAYVPYSTNRFCIIRDILAGGVEVPDKCSLTIIYTARTTV